MDFDWRNFSPADYEDDADYIPKTSVGRGFRMARLVARKLPAAVVNGGGIAHTRNMIAGFPANSGWGSLDNVYSQMYGGRGRDPISGFTPPRRPHSSAVRNALAAMGRGQLPSPTSSVGKREVAAVRQVFEGKRGAARQLFLPAPPPGGGPRVGYFDWRRLPAKYRRVSRSRQSSARPRRPPPPRSQRSRSTMNVALLSRLPMSFLRGQRAPRSFRVV